MLKLSLSKTVASLSASAAVIGVTMLVPPAATAAPSPTPLATPTTLVRSLQPVDRLSPQTVHDSW